MTTAYLIAAHHRPDRYRELVAALEGSDSIVITHVDAKSDPEPFRAASPADHRHLFVKDPDRVRVTWGGWSVVEASLVLLRRAAPLLAPLDHVVFLSGDSYPLQPQHVITELLENSAPLQFVSHVAMPSERFAKPITRISRLHLEWDPRDGRRHLAPRAVNALHVPLAYRRALDGRTPHAGSGWLTLTADAARWVLDQARDQGQFVRFARRTAIPDEFFFHTLLLNSPYASSCRPSLMFADWSRPTWPKPATIDADHIAGLVASRLGVDQDDGRGLALFARKVLDTATADLIRARLWPLDPDPDLIRAMQGPGPGH